MKNRTEFVLVAVSLICSLILGEVLLRAYFHFYPRTFEVFSDQFAESFYFYFQGPRHKSFLSAGRFDPLFGWRSGPVVDPDGATYNAQGFRSLFDFQLKKDRPRIILVGDSFIQGMEVRDNHTVAFRLGEALGPGVEVFNMGVGGFGVDQIAILATEIAPRYRPDMVIFSFIADDLRRSCLRFAWGQALKPYFRRTKNGVEPAGIPLPTPTRNAEYHQRPWRRALDTVEAGISRSRLLALAFSPYLESKRRDCIDNLNASILAYARDKLAPQTKLIFAHLEGELPPALRENFRQLGIRYLDIPSMAKTFGVTLGKKEKGHYDEQANAFIAGVFSGEIRRRGLFHFPKVSLNRLF